MIKLVSTEADKEIAKCIEIGQSFAVIAGAGSGKTTSLIAALDQVRETFGPRLRQNGQRVACITYTKRAVEVIRSRLGFDEMFVVSTLHSFLWGEMGRFQKDIREALIEFRIPELIAAAQEEDNGGNSQKAQKARRKVAQLASESEVIPSLSEFKYDDSVYSNYSEGLLGHDDVVALAGYILAERANFRKLLGIRYPYIFVDEAQDMFVPIVDGLNLIGFGEGPPLTGYFGDPWQQIYEKRASDFGPPNDGKVITKKENFRCAPQIVTLLNSFRDDLQQLSAGDAASLVGSVEIALVRAEEPAGHRKRYTDDQLDRALSSMDEALRSWSWDDRKDVIRLFLARQMIARRLGFSGLHALFTGKYASQRAQNEYEDSQHYLLRPFVQTIVPLLSAHQHGDQRAVIDLLRNTSPTFDVTGVNAKRSLRDMIEKSKSLVTSLSETWDKGTIGDVLKFSSKEGLIRVPERLREQLIRKKHDEDYDEELHSEQRGEWLADDLFSMGTSELGPYVNFILENTPYSTQHGVKGEEYPNVLVVYDDVEAGWNNYNFAKLLTPQTAGEPTDGQRGRGKRLAYVSFSRAEQNLRVLLFTRDPEASRDELSANGLFQNDQIVIAN